MRHGYKDEGLVRFDTFRIECQQVVENAKLSYLMNLGNKKMTLILAKKLIGKLSTKR